MMLEQGLIDTWMNEFIVNSTKCNTLRQVVSSYSKPVVRLTFHQIGIFLLIIPFGLLLTVFVLFTENMRELDTWGQKKQNSYLHVGKIYRYILSKIIHDALAGIPK